MPTLTLNGIAFEVEVEVDDGPIGLQEEPSQRDFLEERDSVIFRWDCATQEGRRRVRLTEAGALQLPALVRVHHEAWFGGDDTGDTIAAMRTKARIARLLGVRSLSEVEAAVNSLMGVPAIFPDMGPFDWLKPIASFLVRMRVDYCLFTLSNAEHDITMYMAIPHRVRLHLSIERFCDLEAAEKALEAGDPPVEQRVPVPPAEELNRRLRRRYIESILEKRRRTYEDAPVMYPVELAQQIQALQAELAALDGE